MEMKDSNRAWADLVEPSLTHQKVLNIAGVSNPMLQTWIARGFIALKAKSPGTGNKRKYSPLEAINIVLLNNLVLQGVNVSHAAYFVKDDTTRQQILLNAEYAMPETRAEKERERDQDRAMGRRVKPDRRRDLLIFRRRPDMPGITMIGSPGMIQPYQATELNYEDFSRGYYLPDLGLPEPER